MSRTKLSFAFYSILILSAISSIFATAHYADSLDWGGNEWDVVGCEGAEGNHVGLGGRFDHAIDDKGRVSVPARIREVLQRDNLDSLFITNWIAERERCLAIYLPSHWDKFVGTLSQRVSLEPSMQRFQMFFIGGAHEVQVDRQGRILIPPRLREYAHLDRDVTFNTMTDHFQLWDKPTLERILDTTVQQIIEDPEFMRKLNL